MENNATRPVPWLLVKFALVLAALSSAWALAGGEGCGSCAGASALVGGKGLALAGLAYYAVLLTVATALGPCVVVHVGILLAAGVHVGLTGLLVHAGIFCPPCFTAAAAAVAALVCEFLTAKVYPLGLNFLLPLVVLVIHGWAFITGILPAAVEAKAVVRMAVEEEMRVPAAAPGRVRMVVYSRADCGYCIQLERYVMPELVRDFGDKLAVERRPAEDLPGMPTPTLILSGAGGRHLFPGLPPVAMLRQKIEDLMGESHAR
jgi:hypothetical protein